MSLLELSQVCKRYRDGPRQRVVLCDASLELYPGELVVVFGRRRSGRSTLLRIAAGIEAPDAGAVLFEGRDLADHGEGVLGDGIGFCQRTFRSAEWQSVLDQVMVGLLARGASPALARSRALEALERTGAEDCRRLRLDELDSAEQVRVALARTLAPQPRLLILDELTKDVDLLERDSILALIRSLADEGIAVFASASESAALSGADRALTLGEGELRGAPGPELAPVLALRPSNRLAASG